MLKHIIFLCGATLLLSCHPINKPAALQSTNAEMILIPAGEFDMGGDNEEAMPDELPKHRVRVSSFEMDAGEVSNADFDLFVQQTGYITTAERTPDWEVLKTQLPPGTPKPDDKSLVPASLVFISPSPEANARALDQWWHWVPGANRKHPEGPKSDLSNRANHPVVHLSWDDAQAYARWAEKRLPTEAEWEWAARGGLKNTVYPWGSEGIDTGSLKANSWQGEFPSLNTQRDGFSGTAPTASFPANGYGLDDMAGNVWEWCADRYDADYYKTQTMPSENPQGPAKSYDPEEPYADKRVLRGGSFLCNDSYCSGYRVSRRMKSTFDTGMSNVGFRCVRDVN